MIALYKIRNTVTPWTPLYNLFSILNIPRLFMRSLFAIKLGFVENRIILIALKMLYIGFGNITVKNTFNL